MGDLPFELEANFGGRRHAETIGVFRKNNRQSGGQLAGEAVRTISVSSGILLPGRRDGVLHDPFLGGRSQFLQNLQKEIGLRYYREGEWYELTFHWRRKHPGLAEQRRREHFVLFKLNHCYCHVLTEC